MAATTPSNSKSPEGENATPLTFEDNLNQFWQKNRMAVLGLCALVLVAILGKGVWDHMQRQKEAGIESDYAAASTPEQLRAFASAHPGHELAAIAELRIADEAYSKGKGSEAMAAYAQSRTVLKDGPLAARARLGEAMAKIQAGHLDDGRNDLKQIAGDASQLNAVRAEAAYDLASLAAEAHNAADVQTYIGQLNQIDPASIWARRAVALQASLPAAPASAAAPATSSDAPKIDIKVPGK